MRPQRRRQGSVKGRGGLAELDRTQWTKTCHQIDGKNWLLLL
jgi:hypothetical protein